MAREFLLGLDAGGGAGRCLLIDLNSQAVVTAQRRWSHSRVPDSGGLGSLLDLEGIWNHLSSAVHEALARASARPEQVLGVAATSMRHSLIVLDADGKTLHAGANRDSRALAEAFQLASSRGAELARRTGRWPIPIFVAPRLQWLARSQPDVWERAAIFFTLSDWLAHRMCGARTSERSQAGETMLLDVATREWAWDLIDALGLRSDVFPPLGLAGQPAGRLGVEAARALGLCAGTPVAIAGADTQCALLGAGAVSPGSVVAVAGTTAPVQLVIDRPLVDPEARLWTGQHVLADQWVLESNGGSMGDALESFARTLYPESPQPAASLLAWAGESEPGARGILSTLGAEVMNARELALPIASLTLTQPVAPDTRADLARAIAEGLAYGVRANAEQLQALSGMRPSSFALTGGLSRSAVWSQILADVLQQDVEVGAVAEASALGAAICAGSGAGVFPDLAEGARALGRVSRVHRPDPERASLYGGLFASWGELRAARAEADGLARSIALRNRVREGSALPTRARVAPRPRILATAELDDAGLAALRELGELDHGNQRGHRRLLTGAALIEALAEVEVFITEIDVVDAAALARLPRLRVIGVCRADAVNVDVEACSAYGVPVLHAPGRNAGAVADLTLAFLLMLARKLPEADAFLREPGGLPGDLARLGRAVATLRGQELWRRTVGLIGLGAVGREVARRLSGFGARVLAADPQLAPEAAWRCDAELVDLDTLLAESDFVSLHAAVNPSSRALIGAAQLARMKRGAFLINTARGALLDENALAEALRSGQLAGAALDTFSVEPPGADHPLLQLPGVIATPHIGGNTEELATHQGSIMAEALAALLRGAAPKHVLNPATLAGFDWKRPRPAPDPQRAAELSARPRPAITDLQRDAHAQLDLPALQASASGDPELRAQLEVIVRDFLARLGRDRKLHDLAAQRDVTLRFVATDLALELWLRLGDGRFSAGLGAPESPADVVLRMSADALDGMLSGRLDATELAMNGRLGFIGDATKAMTLAQLQPGFRDHYGAARAAAGAGDRLTAELSRLAHRLAASAGEAPSGADGLRQELVRTVDELFTQQLITATGGNVSARIGAGEELWITPSQLYKGSLSADALVRIDLDGEPLEPDARSPSSERLMHCAAYRARPDARAVVHAHAPSATILANTGLPFLPISTEAAFIGELPRVPFIMPGSGELAAAVGEALGSSRAVLLQNHGLLVAARSLRRAADMAEIIERSAAIILGCYALGKPPPTLPDATVELLRRTGELIA